MSSAKYHLNIIRLLLVLTLGHCMVVENLFLPTAQQQTTTAQPEDTTIKFHSSEQLPDHYWMEKLKESVFKTISPDPLFNKEIFYGILSAPFYGKSNTFVETGDTVTLASGDLRTEKNGAWLFCEEDCTDCSPCNTNTTTQQLYWKVKRIRHETAPNTFHYELQFNVNPFVESNDEHVTNGRLTGHVYSIKDPRPPMKEKDYLLNVDDYNAYEYDDIMENKYQENGIAYDFPLLNENPSKTNSVKYSSMHRHRHVNKPRHPLLRSIKTKPTKIFPDYYNLIYNEVLQAILSNSNFWKSIIPLRNDEKCERQDHYQNETSQSRNYESLINTADSSIYDSPQRTIGKLIYSMKSQPDTLDNNFNTESNVKSPAITPFHTSNDLTWGSILQRIRNSTVQRRDTIDNAATKPTTFDVVAMDKNTQSNRETNISNLGNTVSTKLISENHNRSSDRTHATQNLNAHHQGNNYILKRSNSNQLVLPNQEYDLTITAVPETTAVTMILPQDLFHRNYSKDTKVPISNFATKLNNTTNKKFKVIKNPAMMTTYHDITSIKQNTAKPLENDNINKQLANAIISNANNAANLEAIKEFKFYNQLLKQLVLATPQTKISQTVPATNITSKSNSATKQRNLQGFPS